MNRWIVALILLFIFGGVGCAQGTGNGQWENSLAPKGKTSSVLSLAEKGTAKYTILLPAQPTTQERKAADDLKEWLDKITGAHFRIANEPAVPAGNYISVGQTVTAAKSKVSDMGLGTEGYAIKIKGRNIFLQGGSMRGPIHAVYALLEEDLGCRWYAKGSATIPYIADLKAKIVSRSYVPVLEYRDPAMWDAVQDADWALRNKVTSIRTPIPEEYGGYMAVPTSQPDWFEHTFELLVPPAQYFKEHPEYYSEINGIRTIGQLCLTNRDVLQITIENAKRALRESPNSKIIGISQNDGWPMCDCVNCRAMSEKEGSKSGPLLAFVNKVAEALEPEFPNVRVSTLAYLDTFLPPKTIRPHRNVIIHLCTDSHTWAEPFLPVTSTEKFQNAMKGWADIGANIYIWDYIINYNHYLAPMPNMQVTKQNIDFFIKHNAKGIMLQGETQTPGSADSTMKAWIWAKQLWDPSRDTLSLIKDFTYGYYGEAGEPMMKYQMVLWDMWEKGKDTFLRTPKGGIRYEMDPRIFNGEYIYKASVYFDEAKKLAKDPEILRRVEVAELAAQYVQLCQFRDKLINREKIDDFARYESMLKKFEKVIKREGITHFKETDQSDVDTWLNQVKKLVADDADGVFPFRATVDGKSIDGLLLPARWRFSLDSANEGVNLGWQNADFDDSEWGGCRVDLDAGWEKQGYDPKTPNYGWYRLKITVPQDFDGKRIYMHFGAVDEDAWVYVDGNLAIEHTCEALGITPNDIWNLPFSVELTNLVTPGKEHVIAVKVFNLAGMGGIWQPVYLMASPDPLTVPDQRKAITTGIPK